MHDTSFRKVWDEAAFEDAGRKRRAEAHARAIDAKTGKKKRRLPEPTKLASARDDLHLNANENRTVIINHARQSQPGFFCDVCRYTYKDSSAYLGHINGRLHLRRLGIKARVGQSSLNDVRLRLAELRAQTRDSSNARRYDFFERVEQVKRESELSKREKALNKSHGQKPEALDDSDVAKAMGFSSFGK